MNYSKKRLSDEELLKNAIERCKILSTEAEIHKMLKLRALPYFGQYGIKFYILTTIKRNIL